MTATGENHKGKILAVLESVSHFVQDRLTLLPYTLLQEFLFVKPRPL